MMPLINLLMEIDFMQQRTETNLAHFIVLKKKKTRKDLVYFRQYSSKPLLTSCPLKSDWFILFLLRLESTAEHVFIFMSDNISL